MHRILRLATLTAIIFLGCMAGTHGGMGDDHAPMPPPAVAADYTPPLPSPSIPAADIERIVDLAVSRAMKANQPVTASAQSQAPAALTMAPQPQLVYLAASQPTAVVAPLSVPVNVLVPASLVRRVVGNVGLRLANVGHPKVKTFMQAPTAIVSTPTYTPVIAAPQAALALPTPQAQVLAVYPTKQAPSKSP